MCGNAAFLLGDWSEQSGEGRVGFAPGLVFSEVEDVVPDVIWITDEKFAAALNANGHLCLAPEIAIEVLSPGTTNERRDREAKLKLYSRRGVHEYWILDWRTRRIEIYRRENTALQLVATLYETDTLETPLLAGFSCQVRALFKNIPRDAV